MVKEVQRTHQVLVSSTLPMVSCLAGANVESVPSLAPELMFVGRINVSSVLLVIQSALRGRWVRVRHDRCSFLVWLDVGCRGMCVTLRPR